LIKNGKYFLPPQKDNNNFKELFKHLTSAGAGRPVDENGFPQGPWTADLLAAAITQIDANGSGVDLRTVQLWFQDNDKGISTDNIRWLARVLGCDDPDTTSQWQTALSISNSRLVTERKKKRAAGNLAAQPTPQEVQSFELKPPFETVDLGNVSIRHFNLEKTTERLFENQSSFSLPIVVFTAAAALGLIAFTLNIHSVVYTPPIGQAKQVGFLWAPNWTIVFLVILPVYLFFLVELLRSWKNDWRRQLFAEQDQTLGLNSWESRVASASYSYWAVLFITILIASGYNWIATHLVPLTNANAGGWPVDWGKIAIFRPDIISDCAILLCLSGGWPASVPCARARAEFIRRITPWPVEPPLQIWRCPMGAAYRTDPQMLTADRIYDILFKMEDAPLQSLPNSPAGDFDLIPQFALLRQGGGPAARLPEAAILNLVQGLSDETGTADIDISGQEFNFVRSIRVFDVQANQRESGSEGDCERSARVRLGSYSTQGDYRWSRAGIADLPDAHFGTERWGSNCPSIWHRSVFVEWRDYEGNYGFEQVNY